MSKQVKKAAMLSPLYILFPCLVPLEKSTYRSEVVCETLIIRSWLWSPFMQCMYTFRYFLYLNGCTAVLHACPPAHSAEANPSQTPRYAVAL